MEELIFFAVIILFSIIDSIARTRKKRRAAESGQTRSAPAEWEDDHLPTHDTEPSYDDAYEAESTARRTLPEYAKPYGSRGTSEDEPAKSSRGMIPSDIWEEIVGVARGQLPAPAPPPPPVEIEPIRPRPVQTHRVHRAHAGYGTDPSSRAPSEQDGLDPLKKTLGRDAAAVRRQLGSGRKSALRQAVILHEVLGPPAATRPERFTE